MVAPPDARATTRLRNAVARATKKRKLTTGQKTANKVISAARALVEHGFAHLKTWRILTRLRTDPARATDLLRALLVLTNLETAR